MPLGQNTWFPGLSPLRKGFDEISNIIAELALLLLALLLLALLILARLILAMLIVVSETNVLRRQISMKFFVLGRESPYDPGRRTDD